MRLVETLASHFPKSQLLAADFSELPPPALPQGTGVTPELQAVCAPLVASKIDDGTSAADPSAAADAGASGCAFYGARGGTIVG